MSGSRPRCGSDSVSDPGKISGSDDSLDRPESPSLARGKRAPKSALRTEAIVSSGARLAVGVPVEVTQPTNTRESDVETHTLATRSRPRLCKLLTELLLGASSSIHQRIKPTATPRHVS